MISWRLVGRTALALVVVPVLIVSSASGQVEVPPQRQNVVASPIVGQVLDVSGNPITDAQIVGSLESGDEFLDDQASVGPAATDSAGRFTLAWPELASRRGEPALWIYRSGYRLRRVNLGAGRLNLPVQVRLEPASVLAGASVQVVAPRGEPVAQAHLVPTHWFEGGLAANTLRVWSIPRRVGVLAAKVTGQDGRTILDGVAALRLAGVAIESTLGSQVATWDESPVARHRVVSLQPVGRLVGQVQADRPETAVGLKVQVTTTQRGRVVGRVSLTTDRNGRFSATDVVAGQVEIRVEPPPGSLELPERVVKQTLVASGEITTEIPLRRGILISGLVRDRSSRMPIPGAWVAAQGAGDGSTRWGLTDQAGCFAVPALPGSAVMQVELVPPPYLLPSTLTKAPSLVVPDAVARFEWPAIELDRGLTLRGKVADDLGQPVEAGLPIEVRWTTRSGRSHVEEAAIGMTLPDGRYEVGSIPPAVDLLVTIHRVGQRGGAALRLSAWNGSGPVDLTLPPGEALLSPTGRVVDAAGHPVVGALVQFRVAGSLMMHGSKDGRRLALDGLDAVVTDDQGRYHAPRRLDSRHRYLAAAEAAGCESGRTRAIATHANPESNLRFPDIVVERHSNHPTVVGRVLDSARQPIVGVVVRDLARHQATTDPDGWFQLEEVGEGAPPFLFAERVGYRFFGRTIQPEDRAANVPLELTLTRLEERPDAGPGTAPTADLLPRMLEDCLVRSLVINPLLERLLSLNEVVTTSTLLEHLAATDPRRVVGWLQAGVVADQRVSDGLKRMVVRGLAFQDADDADAVATTIEDPMARAEATLDGLDLVNTADPGLARDRVERVARDLRSIEDPGCRALLLARVAESWVALGKPDQARSCLDEAQRLAGLLGRSGPSAKVWKVIVTTLAQVSPERARQRMDELVDPIDADRCRLAVAMRWSRTRPAEAVRIFQQIRDPRLKIQGIAELCHRLARVDLGLARELADSLGASHPCQSAYALGMIAAAIAATDRPAATTIIRAAFHRLETMVAIRNDANSAEPSLVAAALLAVVEQIDPLLVDEYFWKTLSLHHLRPQPALRADALLATLLTRFDSTAARLLFDPRQIKRASIAPNDLPAALLAAVQLDPIVAVNWAIEPRDTSDHPFERSASPTQPLLDLVAAWTLPPTERRRRVVHHHLDLWVPHGTAHH